MTHVDIFCIQLIYSSQQQQQQQNTGLGVEIHAFLNLNFGRRLLVPRAVFEALWKRKPLISVQIRSMITWPKSRAAVRVWYLACGYKCFDIVKVFIEFCLHSLLKTFLLLSDFLYVSLNVAVSTAFVL